MKTKRMLSILLILLLCLTCIPVSSIPAQAASGSYWVKVNKKANVATVYQNRKGKWVPIKAMLTSCGGKNTPVGTFNTKAKYRWHELVGRCFGQYNTRIVNGILFHSVWYHRNGNRKSQNVKEFNKLGKTASHGCVRLATEDAKWIYEHCALGTKVTIYSSSDPGPLGKPAGYKMPSKAGKKNWDPTDVSSKNPYYTNCPVLNKKISVIPFGSKTYNDAKKLVNAKQKNKKAVKKLTITVKKYNASKKKYVSAKYSSSSEGKYQITYKAVGKTGVSITKTFNFTVSKDMNPPVITLVKNADQVSLNSMDASQWLASARLKDGTDCFASTTVSILLPGKKSFKKAMTMEEAELYSFSEVGEYKVKYISVNPNKPSVTTAKTVTVTVKK